MKVRIIIATVLYIGIILSTSTAKAVEIPYKGIAMNYYRIPYQTHTYNCLWKAQAYCDYLRSKGVDAKVVTGKLEGEKFYRHAWVEFNRENKWFVVDLTDKPGTWGFERKYYHWLR